MNENGAIITTPKEAIETIKANMPTSGYMMLRESLDMAIEALEKQVPKAPIMMPYFEDMPDEEYLCCPTCGEILTDRLPFKNESFYFYCLNCGQKFDWSKK